LLLLDDVIDGHRPIQTFVDQQLNRIPNRTVDLQGLTNLVVMDLDSRQGADNDLVALVLDFRSCYRFGSLSEASPAFTGGQTISYCLRMVDRPASVAAQRVQPGVLIFLHQFKVLDRVVRLVTVDVVDDFALVETPPNMGFHHETV
jgi:hypothetical protein